MLNAKNVTTFAGARMWDSSTVCMFCFSAKRDTVTLDHKDADSFFFFEGVCLVEHESGNNASAISPPNTDGSVDHGIFQLNDNYWCDGTSRNASRTYKNACKTSCDCELPLLNNQSSMKCPK